MEKQAISRLLAGVTSAFALGVAGCAADGAPGINAAEDGLRSSDATSGIAAILYGPSMLSVAAAPTQTVLPVAEHVAHGDERRRSGRFRRIANFTDADAAPARDLHISAAIRTPRGWMRLPEGGYLHEASGLVCPAALDTLGETDTVYELKEINSFNKDTNDVGCQYQANNVAISIFAKLWPDVEAMDHAIAMVSVIQQENETVTDDEIATVGMRENPEEPATIDMEPVVAGGFRLGVVDEVPFKSGLWLTKTHGWHVKVYATFAVEDAVSELVAALAFAEAHLAVRKKQLGDDAADETSA